MVKIIEVDDTPLANIKCVECQTYKIMPVGEYDICTECYFKLLDKMEDETGVRRGHTK